MQQFKVDTVVSGALDNNTYILQNNANNECVLIDPAGSGKEIIGFLKENNLKVCSILLTHGHYDHIESLNALKEFSNAPVGISQADVSLVLNPVRYSKSTKIDETFAQPEIILTDGELFKSAGLEIKIIETPGHTRGGMCFVIGNVIFTGDTLFLNSVGRTDLDGGDKNDLFNSLDKLFNLEGEYTCYPGHGPATSLDHERDYNFFYKHFKRRSKNN